MQSEGRRGGKRYGSGRTLLSVVSFTKSQENRSKYMQNWQKNHGRLYLRKDIHQTWKRLKAECLYSSDTTFAQHLLSLELRRQARYKNENIGSLWRVYLSPISLLLTRLSILFFLFIISKDGHQHD